MKLVLLFVFVVADLLHAEQSRNTSTANEWSRRDVAQTFLSVPVQSARHTRQIRLEKKMKFAKQTIFVLLLVLAASFTASAEESFFVTLKQDSYWGKASLPAGQYRVTLVSQPVTKAIIASVDGKTSAIVVPVSRDYNYACDRTALTLTPSGGSYAITGVCYADTKLVYFFPNLAPGEQHIAQTKTFVGK